MAAPPLPTLQVQNQLFAPIAPRRELNADEKRRINKGLKRLFPKFRPGDSTPLTELLANPVKRALLRGAVLGAVGSFAGGATAEYLTLFPSLDRAFIRPTQLVFGARSPVRHQPLILGAAVAGIAVGLRGAVTGYLNRRRANEDILDLMARAPEGATRRDLLSDPVRQQQLNQDAEDARSRNMVLLYASTRVLPELIGVAADVYRSSSSSSGSSRDRARPDPIVIEGEVVESR